MIKYNPDLDWPEDAAHENGNYMNNCCECKQTFIGYKRRVVCKKCHIKNELKWNALTPEQQEAEKLENLKAIEKFYKERNEKSTDI